MIWQFYIKLISECSGQGYACMINFNQAGTLSVFILYYE